MGLKKSIELENGIIASYHRVVKISKITNNSNLIEIASYINKEKRQQEIEALLNSLEMNVFIHTTFISKEYNEEETIKDIYEYLKTTEKFKDAENA